VLNKLALGVVVACAFAAFAAQGASAAPTCNPPTCYTLSFNHAVLDAGGSPANIVTPTASSGDPTGAPLTVDANLTGPAAGGAAFAVTPSGISFPTYHFTADGFNGTIDTTLKNNATGTLDFATGATSMTADFVATVKLATVPGQCNLDTGNVSMSTANTQPLMGVAFPASSNGSGSLTGAGAFGGTWSSVTPSPSSAQVCTLLAIAGYFGPGGIWVSRNLTPPSPTVTHKKLKAVKAGKRESVKIKVANAGQVGTGSIKLCLKVPRHFKVNKKCHTLTNVAGGKTDVVTFKVKAPKKKPKHTKTYKLRLTPSTTTDGLMGNAGLKAQIIKFKVKR
jgi:hypothetical protein